MVLSGERTTSGQANRTPIYERAQKLGIVGIGKKDIKKLAEKSRGIMQGIQGRALRDVFGPQLDELQYPGAGENATNLFAPLLNDIFDKGTNRDIRCEVPFGKGLYLMHEKAAPIYTRSSFISKILNEEERMDMGFISMGRVDLERFRDADFDVGSKNGIRPADVIINKTANAIRDALSEVWKSEKIDAAVNSYEVGRYGGDELIVAFIGKEAQLHRGKVMSRLIDILSKKDGFYKNAAGQVEAGPIRLKKDAKTGEPVEWIELPESRSDEEKTMYKEYLQRGLILNELDFEREKRKYSQSGIFDFSAYRKDYPEGSSMISYPNDITGTKAKIAYLVSTHPELRIYFGIAELFDKEDKTAADQMKRQTKLLAVVENSIFDRLLGDMIYSKPHFLKHMERGEIDDLLVVDYKFLKEQNTAQTYADADRSIRTLWDILKAAIPDAERYKVMIGRFAGAIYSGVRRGEALSAQCQANILDLKSIPVGRAEPYSVPLGYAHITGESMNTEVSPHKRLEKIERDSDRNFYSGLSKDLATDKQLAKEVMEVDIGRLTQREYQPLSKTEIYALFLRGQRKTARIGKLLEAIGTKASSENNIYRHLQESFRDEVVK